MSKEVLKFIAAIAFTGVLAAANFAGAVPIEPAPDSDFASNSWIERFNANGLVFAVELQDSPGAEFGSFGIYYDTASRITLFGADDIGAGQAAMVDLVGGSVMDVDSISFDFFSPQTGDFGFYFETNEQTIYSESHLNSDPSAMSIGTYASLTGADQYLITLDFWDEDTGSRSTLAIEAVGGIRAARGSSAVPEPNAAILFGMGALVLGTGVRRSRK